MPAFKKNYRTTDEIPIPSKLIDQVIGQEKAARIIKKAAKQRRHVLLIGEPGCLIGDERVFLGTGAVLKLEKFGKEHLEKISRKVMVASSNKTAKAEIFHHYKRQRILEILMESGKSIRGTYNHPLLVVGEASSSLDRGPSRRAWKRLDQIRVGDRVAVVNGVRCTIDYYLDTDFAPVRRNRNGPKFHGRLPDKLTPSLAALFGYIIGDGWVDSNRERLGFVVADDEKDILPHLLNLVNEEFGISPLVTTRTLEGRKVPLHYVNISNKDIYSNLEFLRKKRIPDLVLASGNEVAASFLKWLFTADGTVYNNGRGRRGIGLKAKDVELLRDVQTLLIRFGIQSRILNPLSTTKGEAPQLAIRSGYDIIKFHKKIGFACAKKTARLGKLAEEAPSFARRRKQFSERVVKVSDAGVADVYDIEVPEWHRFIANGVVSHNTGKTMLAQAMAEMMPSSDLEDVLVYRNNNDENMPLVKAVKTYPTLPAQGSMGDGQGRLILQRERLKNRIAVSKSNSIIAPAIMVIVVALFALSLSGFITGNELIVIAALMLSVVMFGSVLLFTTGLTRRMGAIPGMSESNEPKLIVDNTGMTSSPFIDSTGSRAGALFGDVRHDPLQSGGLGTPAHLRVEGGAIHKANKGVLFIDEISRLEPKSQQDLLTAMQEKKFSITGQSEMSSGALVKTTPAPCDFVLVAAGNLQDIQKMHPALRSRIRGYGYEVFMDSTVPDTDANRDRIVQFVAQEVKKDGKIPAFDHAAVDEIIEEARRRSGRKGKLTLVLRDLGGLVRAAGDIAVEKSQKTVRKEDVMAARGLANPIEAQVVAQAAEYTKDYSVFNIKGYSVGKVNGLAVLGSSALAPGMVMPIVAEVTPASSRAEGRFIPTGKLGKIATEAVKNVSAIIKKHMGRDVSNYDMHVQFLQTYEGVEGDSASISVAISIISAMEGIPVDQSVAMTGSLSVRGEVLPVGGVTNKVEAAIGAGIKKVIIPKKNFGDVYISKDRLKHVTIVPVTTLAEVLQHALKQNARREEIIKELKKSER